MDMRRSHQRQLGARRSACVAAERCDARDVVAELVWAHEESIALVRMLLLTGEQSGVRQADADHAIAIDAWANHVMQLIGLLAMVDELHRDPLPGLRSAECAAATPLLPRFRRRGDCLGQAGQPPHPGAE
jgi:hypothetical protein